MNLREEKPAVEMTQKDGVNWMYALGGRILREVCRLLHILTFIQAFHLQRC